MKALVKPALPALLVVAAALGCGRPRAIMPTRPVPAGTALFLFTRKVEGPVDLTVDGTRVPVARSGHKKGRSLAVAGLAPGKHRFVLLSPREAFGPDQLEIDLGGDRGEYRVLFTQNLKSVLYGQPEPAPAAPGLPGVRATLEP